MQLMVVEFSRTVLGDEEANSTEFDHSTSNPVIDLMPEQRDIADMGGTMRLGLYPCQLQPGTHAAEAYGVPSVEERHRHRFEFNNSYRQLLEEKGMVFSGLSPDRRLVEIAEIRDHPFMVGTQFHPEFLSRPTRPHPLFSAFVRAACQHARPGAREVDRRPIGGACLRARGMKTGVLSVHGPPKHLYILDPNMVIISLNGSPVRTN